MTTSIDLIRPGDRVLCAVSGGMDSVYLLEQMRRILPERGAAVLAAHFNHHLRGAESDRDEAFVRDLCAEWAIPLFVGHAAGLSGSEAEARAARYAFLEETAERERCAWILTAHTADDQLETMLLHLARGSGLRGLAGIPPRRGKLLRPMLDLTRAEVEACLTAQGIAHVEDSTNAASDYARNRIRHAAVPALRAVNAEAARHAARAAESLREDETFLQSLADAALSLDSEPGVSLRDLRCLARPVRARVFRALFGAGLTQLHVELLHDFCAADETASLDLPGCCALREQGRLFPAPETPPPLPELELKPGMDETLPAHGLRVIVTEKQPPAEIYGSFTVYRFKSTEIRDKLMLTARRSGDRFRPAGRGCTKRLSDLLAERGVPASMRDQIPVLRDSAGVAGALNFTAERLAPQAGDDVLTVLLEKKEKEKREEV